MSNVPYPHLAVIREGDLALIEFEVTDCADHDVLMDPLTGVFVTLTDPNKVVKVAGATATRVATGIYQYEYLVPSTGPRGMWAFEARAIHGNRKNLSQVYGVFRVVP